MAYVAEQPERDPELDRYVEVVRCTPLPGSLRRLLLGGAEIATRSGRVTGIPLSERSLVEASGLSRNTVLRTLRLAIARRWLVMETPQRGAVAARYALTIPTALKSADLPSTESLLLLVLLPLVLGACYWLSLALPRPRCLPSRCPVTGRLRSASHPRVPTGRRCPADRGTDRGGMCRR